MSSNNFFIIFFFAKYLKIHQLNIIKIIKKGYKKACERYQSLSKEEKEKKQQYGPERYKIYQKLRKKSLLSVEKYITK